ncbi:Smr/MutS family protein [Pedobacter arcticus]|uniref:Smr/MutS family protein n=1 Tax=Pedobacter arcticus TaxID=752140 RepID=UPI0002E7C321|nr:Smr/MutS family protein [Pedobacter arcticus]
MKYQLGEFVRFVDERREGYITKIINDEMVGVTGDDDFEIPVMVTNITRVHGHSSNPETKQASPEEKANIENFVEKGIFLVAIPDANKGSVVHFSVVNETSYQLMVGLKTLTKDVYKGAFFGELASEKSVKVFSAALPELDLWPTLNFQILYYTATNKAPVKPLEFSVKFKSKDFAGSKQQVALMKANGWLFRMDEPVLVLDAQKIKESFFKPSEEKVVLQKPAKEVDLHIEKLRDDHDFLSKREIMDIQLDHFQKSLEAAIVHKYESIVFIHGAGNGTLQHEIHKAISKNTQVKTFMDAQKEKFGYGATKIILK